MGGVAGMDGGVSDIEFGPDGRMYVGGSFTVIGEVMANNVAVWDGSSWSSLGTGVNDIVLDLKMAGSDLYAAGEFGYAGGKEVRYIAKWNGEEWSALGSGMDDYIFAVEVIDGIVYAAGVFDKAGGISASYIAKWNGLTWSPLGEGLDSQVYSLQNWNSSLVVGGTFLKAGGVTVNRIAKWDGSQWSALGIGVVDSLRHSGSVSSMAVYGSELYVAGNFNQAGGVSANNVARWNGSAWSPVGSGISDAASNLIASGGNVYASGADQDQAGAYCILKWDGTTWSKTVSGLSKNIGALQVRNGEVYAGGSFTQISGVNYKGIVKWNDTQWSIVGAPKEPLGLDGAVNAIAVSDTAIYAAGVFSTAGGASASRIAKWDGSSWSSLGTGTSGTITALAVSGEAVYVAGELYQAGGVPAMRIAKWDGAVWSRLGSSFDSGPNGPIRALAIIESTLYVGGSLATVGYNFFSGGKTVNNIAKWDGSEWSAVGSGMNYGVECLAVSGNELYAAGSFTTAGGIEARGIAKWDGSTWSAIGTGLDGYIRALLVSGNEVYVGGRFSVGNEYWGRHVAKWDGNSWYYYPRVTYGYDEEVSGLALLGQELYIALEGYLFSSIRYWKGNQWLTVGSGANGPIRELAARGSDLYVGGDFTIAGGKISTYLAKVDVRYPVMEVSGYGATIVNGDGTPAIDDGTDFGPCSVGSGSVARGFTIGNSGNKELNLTGTPGVVISGPAAGDFSVSLQPEAQVAAGGAAGFNVVFNPSAPGLREATVSLASDDTDASPFTFAIRGTGISPGTVAFTAGSFPVNQGADQVVLTVARSGGTLPFKVTLKTSNGATTYSPPFAPAVAGTDYTELTGAETLLSFAADEMSKQVTVTLLPKTGTQPNKQFNVTLSAPTNAAELGSAKTVTVEILAVDSAKPTLSVTAPTGTKISGSAPIELRGTAGDPKGIDQVEVTLNGGAPMMAILGGTSKPTAVPFALDILPAEGANTLVITAYDLRGNSTAVTRSFTFTRRYVLTLNRNDPAMGTLAMTATPGTGATALSPAAASGNPKTTAVIPGTTVKLTATPKSGFFFDQWLGLPAGAQTVEGTTSFVMPAAGVAVTAAFVVSPFAPPTGGTNVFYGLIQPAEGTAASNATVGWMTGTLTVAGSFSGKVCLDGWAQAVTVTFDRSGASVFTVGGKKQSTLAFGGHMLDLTYWAGTIEATVTHAAGSSEGVATRAIYSSGNKTPAGLLNSGSKGFYTVAFSAKAQTPAVDAGIFPQGYGFGTISLTNTGAVALTGTLADGTAVTGSAALVAGNGCPIFAQLPTPGAAGKKGGSFGGMLLFDPAAADSDVAGTDLGWFRPVDVTGKTALYTNGWPNGIRVDGVGALYATTLKVQAGVGLGAVDVTMGNAQLLLSEGKLEGGILKRVNIHGNAVTRVPAGDGTFTLTLTPGTGGFGGSFTPNWAAPAAVKPGFKGVLIQKGANRGGYGFFISNAKGDADPESGRVLLEKAD